MQLYYLQILELQTSTDWATAAAYHRTVRLQLPVPQINIVLTSNQIQ